jgi:hypothetical protein
MELSELGNLFFSAVLRNKTVLRKIEDPVPGQKSFASSKKAAVPFFPDAGSRRFSRVIPLPPRLFEETKRKVREGFPPAFFGLGACFLPGQQGDRSERPSQ